MIEIILCIIGAYLIGAIPFAYIAGKLAKGSDLRMVGSGNLGFTNAWRTLGAKWSIPVLIFDILKGSVPVWFTKSIMPEHEYAYILSGLMAIVGHNWTIYLRFQGGGKGVATAAGVFFALAPISMVFALCTFLVTLITTKIMSLSSILGAAGLVAAQVVLRAVKPAYAPSETILWISVIVAALIIIRHHSNIRRILKGTEPKFNSKVTEENTQ